MKNKSSFTTSDIQHDPLLFAKLLKRALAGKPAVIEDQQSGGRVIMVQIPESDYKDPWGKPPKEVVAEWEKAEQEFDELDQKQRQPRFATGEEMVRYINKQ